MRIRYLEVEGTQEFDNNRPDNAIYYQYGEKNEKIKEPVTITLHIEIDKEKYHKLQSKYATSLPTRIFSYFGFKH